MTTEAAGDGHVQDRHRNGLLIDVRGVNVRMIHPPPYPHHPDIKKRAVCRAWRPLLFQVSPSDKILINFNPGPRTQVFFAIGLILWDASLRRCARAWKRKSLGVTLPRSA